MELEGGVLVSPTAEVPVIEGEIVTAIRDLASRGVGSKTIQNKAVVYDLLFQASAATLLEVAADAKHLGAAIGFLCVLHTWGQNLLHHRMCTV